MFSRVANRNCACAANVIGLNSGVLLSACARIYYVAKKLTYGSCINKDNVCSVRDICTVASRAVTVHKLLFGFVNVS